MAEAVGFSGLYPAVPIMNFVSMTLLLLLIPGFWKTRIVALVSLVFWLALANLVSFICMIEWRGNTNNAPIWADILAILERIWMTGFFMSLACFAHFSWQRLQPLAVRQLYDTRRRNNLIYFSLTLILPLLWTPLAIFSRSRRYIVEDYGPAVLTRSDWPGLVVDRLPLTTCLLAVGIFNSLAVFNYWRMKRKHIEPDPLKQQYSIRTRKLIIMAHLHILLAVYGLYRQGSSVYDYIQNWVPPTSLAKNIASLQLVLERTRLNLDSGESNYLKPLTTTRILIPLLGFHLFAWFGFEAEIRKAYREALSEFGRLISAAFREHRSRLGPLPFFWSLIALRKAKPQHESTDALSLIDLNVPQITPYISTVARGDDPGRNESIPAPNSIGTAIDVKRQARERAREPARRLSAHKPSIAPLNPANAAMNITDSVPLRRLSHHKPPLPSMNPTASAPEAPGSMPLRADEASNTGRPEMPSTSSPRALHRWYHKPTFVPLAPPNVPTIAGPEASGSVVPRVEGMDGARRQKTSAPQARPRRLSYHKPAFVPLAPANAGAIANGLGQTVPLVEAPRDLISDRNARLQAENAPDSGVPPPPFSSPSTSMAPPPFSAPFGSMDPPPSFSSPSTSTAPPPPFSSPSTSTAPPPLFAASTPSVPPPLSTSIPPHVGEASNTRRTENCTPASSRLSYHKPPFVPLGRPDAATIATPEASGSAPPRREGSNNPRRQETFAPQALPRRLSYHKPAFVPLGRPNASAITTSEASGSAPPRTEGVNNPRRQETFEPRARPRRLSYHKPAFVPLAPANAGAIANGLGQTIPLVEAPRDLISDRNARLQAASTPDSGVPPPPFSSPSTSTAPPPFSAPFASMAPPPPFSSPSTSTAPPPPFSSPSTSTSTSTAPPPFSAPFDSMSPPPAFLSPSTPTAPPSLSDVSTPLSNPSTMTPAPPYQDVNPLFDHTT